jgi:nicotinamide phosphoribosyltransferase
MKNFCLQTDAYKETHWMQYPKGTEYVYSYMESRGGEYNRTVFFGLQYFLMKYFQGVRITQQHIDEAEVFCNQVFNGCKYFNREGWEYILDEHHGRLPIEIKAVPEGSIINTGNALITVCNTDPEVPFLTNFIETTLLNVWYPITVATMSHNIKRLIASYASWSGEEVSPFHLNDFGMRGVSSPESAAIGGAAHLTSFMGTDNLEGIRCAMDYYDSGVCGGSVMAAEHSTITSYGKPNEAIAYKTIIDKCAKNSVVSLVSDSYDIINAVENIYGDELYDYILSGDKKIVIRPDSGDPVDISSKVMNMLYYKFGGEINHMGYKVMNPKIGMIYGDGINFKSIDAILRRLVIKEKFATSNIIFGMGGALLQGINRDTHKFAFKCSAICINGEWRDVYKDPKTDATKVSKRGRLKVVHEKYGAYFTHPIEEFGTDELQAVFKDGEIVKYYNFDEIRDRIVGYDGV